MSHFIPSENPDWNSCVRNILLRFALKPLHTISDFFKLVTDLSSVFNERKIEPSVGRDFTNGLSQFFNISREQGWITEEEFLEDLAPKITQLATKLDTNLQESEQICRACLDSHPETLAEGELAGVHFRPRRLSVGDSGTLCITQDVCASLLACSFLGMFPDTPRAPSVFFPSCWSRGAGTSFPSFDLTSLVTQHQHAKLLCLLNYFTRVTQEDHVTGHHILTFTRKCLDPQHGPRPLSLEDLSTSTAPLTTMQVGEDGTRIETNSNAWLKADFANKYLGGGVLNRGSVQEEIYFITHPELLVGMLFFERMADHEAIEICGAERFSTYSGYARSFQFEGDFKDTTEYDNIGRRKMCILALDGLVYPGTSQFHPLKMLREVNKAYCAFGSPTTGVLRPQGPGLTPGGSGPSPCSTLATGNWGCGAFGGDVALKSLLQWVAASEAGLQAMHYHTFQDTRANLLPQVVTSVKEKIHTVGQLWRLLDRFQYEKRSTPEAMSESLYEWMLNKLEDPNLVQMLQDC